MSSYNYCDQISLYVKEQISAEDAKRQEITAKEILKRLKSQPGIILADEVGMGKTFVALAVAVSAHLSDEQRRPAVVMVPSSLKRKWPTDFKTFVSRCLPAEYRGLKCAEAGRSEEFLKLLDDAVPAAVIFLTHGAMARGLTDHWIQLAIIQRALYRKKNIDRIWHSLFRFSGDLLNLGWVQKHCGDDIWERLLLNAPAYWGEILGKAEKKHKKEKPNAEKIFAGVDNPVPMALIEILPKLNLHDIRIALEDMPERESEHLRRHLATLRGILSRQMKSLWSESILQMKLKLPLLILDEAHHLKNSGTRTASLFNNPDSENDITEISKGALAGVFDRMLFMTATPFQLGHKELISVLDRFNGIDWSAGLNKKEYGEALEDLRNKLDASQTVAIRLERTWGTLTSEDLKVGEKFFESADDWWPEARVAADGLTVKVIDVLKAYNETKLKMTVAQSALKKWVIRHTKSRVLPETNEKIPRRKSFEGAEILLHQLPDPKAGLKIDGEALLPFLLAARAVSSSPTTRPVFAEGLASSYEAFLHTRNKKAEKIIDDEEDEVSFTNVDATMDWYLNRIHEALPFENGLVTAVHPKIQATVDRAMDLWEKGEKVLIFCHYVATGKALRQAISDEITRRIESKAVSQMGLPGEEAMEELEKLGKRFYADPLRAECDKEILKILNDYQKLQPDYEQLTDVVRRMLRTPTYLTRFFPINEYKDIAIETIGRSIRSRGASKMSFEDILRVFFSFLNDRCENEKRKSYIEAVARVQTGSHKGAEVEASIAGDEKQEANERLVANVRLANGNVRQETRQRLMLTFNTPFYPEILIASSVMAEGVDLHLNCRHIIHHDLSWNPSSLEQRTGRVDRIGALAEVCKEPIHIYMPFVAETQDEKMFRVVTDREKWFRFVMGEKYKVDVRNTEAIAMRIPFPAAAAEELAFKLTVTK